MGVKWITYQRDLSRPITGTDVGYATGFLFLMIYLFVGIAFASDIFMNAIEKICGATRKTKYTTESGGVVVTHTKTIPVWNETVANLSLMALGSSAPEILLSVIETLEGLGEQNPGELGPGTIVGSAAFNLMVITAVCITCVGDGRTSRVKLYKVFGFTAFTSLFAYIWMVIVLEWHTKDEVDLWEGVVTLAFFPILLILSYWVDQDCCLCWCNPRQLSPSSSGTLSENIEDHPYNALFIDKDNDHLYNNAGNLNKAALHQLYLRLSRVPNLSAEEITQIIATKLIRSKQHSNMWHRAQLARSLMGGQKLMPVLNEKLEEIAQSITEASGLALPEESKQTIATQVLNSPSVYLNKAVVEFQAATVAVEEAVGNAIIVIHRTGMEEAGFEVHVESYDGNAKSGKQYDPVDTTITFDPDDDKREVMVVIHDNVHWNPDSSFFLRLTVPPEFADVATVGQTHVVEIIIQDDDKPGQVTFAHRGYVFKPVRLVNVGVERHAGTDGDISVEWKIIPGPACEIVTEQSGILDFMHKEMKKFIEIQIGESKDASKVDGDIEKFEIELSNPTGGAILGKFPSITVAISGKTDFKLQVDDVLHAALQISEEAEEEQTYKEQILGAFKVNGGDSSTATCCDYVLHIINFPYKVSFAFIPPTNLWGGWLAFFLALGVVGLLTKIVGETASAFGNALGIDPVITAITFVALGTSLPDTFASKISAQNDKTADNAIGNVTGSNSVNVFLGLGIPWTVGALYYNHRPVKYEGSWIHEPYCVPAGTLTFNVLVYIITAGLSIAILTFRRYSSACGKAELGGPSKMKYLTAIPMFTLWIVYILASSAQVILAHNNGTDISDPFKGERDGVCDSIIARYKRGREGM